MSKRAEEAALKAYPIKGEWVGNQYGEWDNDINMPKRSAFLQGYEQAEKDIEALILKYLDSRNERDYATVGWIKKNFGEYKKEIMGEE